MLRPQPRLARAGRGAAGRALQPDAQARARGWDGASGHRLLLYALAHRPGGCRADAAQRLREVCAQVPARRAHLVHTL
eukprot:5893502-Prymnesium_polylepis.1